MTEQQTTSFLNIAIRVFWMMAGPLVLLILIYNIVRSGGGWWTPSDLGYLGVLAAVGLARWLEFRRGHAETTTGEPATPAQLRRFLVGLAVGGLLVWTVANILGNYVLVA